MNLWLDSVPIAALVGIIASLVGGFISFFFERVVNLQKATLKERKELIQKSAGIFNVFPENINQLTDNPDFDRELQKVRQRIRLFTLTGDSLIAREYLTLKHLLRRGIHIQVLLLDPELDFKQLTDGDLRKEQAEHSISMLLELGRDAEHGGQLEIRFHSTPPAYSILFIDDLLFVSLYSHGSGRPQYSPTLLIRNDDTSLYKFFDSLFEQSWTLAKPIPLDTAN